ncbi:hypothetical protein PAHAL_2G220600 [Panicum hallii]|uniref:TTF-type domain-containing protein n=1 Tax=Panicum hallii TaxID=206008 RepID=A0A2T8KQ11_9POAL|nr:hypothetical protein PAHAL_2G220600 [Panicum hallii]
MPPPEATQEQERVIEENVNPMPPPPPPHLEATQEQEEERVIEEIVNPTPPPPPPPLPPSAPPTYDVSRLPNDPGERQPIASFHANDHDAIRRAYILRGPFQPYAHEFPKRWIGDREHHFNFVWFHNFPWVEYSVKKDVVFCFVCYLFKNKESKGKGTDAFTMKGWKNWNIGENALLKHARSKAHKAAQEKYFGFLNPDAAIDDKIEKWSTEDHYLYKKRLTYSLRCLKFLLHQGLAFRGHDESAESSNRGNFIELLKFVAAHSEEVNKYVLNNAPSNCTLTSPMIQKQIIQCCAIETRKKIIGELGEEPFAILADECSDISHKEQLALCLRYVDASGRPCEHFLGVVHVDDTTSLSLKDAIEALLVSHGLTLTRIRGQGYDGASNMRGDIKGLKTLIMQESPSAYYIHCFAHQLQLVLVTVAKGNNDCVWFFDQVSLLLNIVGVSCKRHGMLRDARIENLMRALDCGELETGSGLNQEMGLARPGDTRWSSHYKAVCNIIAMYPIIPEVLFTLGEDTTVRADWTKIHTMLGAFESFDFVFCLHLMFTILGYTNDLSECLQRREQDILNAITFVKAAKKRMEHLRNHGWDQFLDRVILFCNKHGVQVPAMEGNYVPFGRSVRFVHDQNNDDHFRRAIYIGVIDQISMELASRFDEVNMELLSCMEAFDPSNSFASFDAQKVRRLAEFYPNDISSTDLLKLDFQLDNFIDVLREDGDFKDLHNLVDLSVKLVEKKDIRCMMLCTCFSNWYCFYRWQQQVLKGHSLH